MAKILKAVIDAEAPGLVIAGKQAIDNDMNATGQMLAALLGWPQATFASELAVEGGKATVTREVDGGLQTISVKLPAIVTVDLRLNEPRYASLPNIMKAKKKPLEEKTAADYGVDVTPRLKVVKTAEPATRKAGVKVGSVDELIAEAQDRGGGDLMAVLILAKHDNAHLNDATAKAVTAAKKMGGDIHVLVAGQDAQAVAEAAARLDGVAKVIHVEGEAYGHRLAEPLTALLQGLAGPYEHIVFPGTTSGKNMAPAARRAARRHGDLRDHRRRRPRHLRAADLRRQRHPDRAVVRREEGRHRARRQLRGRRASRRPRPIETAAAAADPGLSSWVEDKVAASDRPELTSARIVVSGGRGVGSEENFAIIEKLADKLGAAVGASRAAVDSGFAPNDWQVGQTGKVVAPELYIAVGISGAIQHLAGMKDSKVIVAINKDEEAPIFQVADYGLVGDLFQIVPELEKKLG